MSDLQTFTEAIRANALERVKDWMENLPAYGTTDEAVLALGPGEFFWNSTLNSLSKTPLT